MSTPPLIKKAKLRLHYSCDFLAVSGAVRECQEIGLPFESLYKTSPARPDLACLVWYMLAWMQHGCFISEFTGPKDGEKLLSYLLETDCPSRKPKRYRK